MNKTQKLIIERRNYTIIALKDRLREEEDYLDAYLKTISLESNQGEVNV